MEKQKRKNLVAQDFRVPLISNTNLGLFLLCIDNKDVLASSSRESNHLIKFTSAPPHVQFRNTPLQDHKHPYQYALFLLTLFIFSIKRFKNPSTSHFLKTSCYKRISLYQTCCTSTPSRSQHPNKKLIFFLYNVISSQHNHYLIKITYHRHVQQD